MPDSISALRGWIHHLDAETRANVVNTLEPDAPVDRPPGL